MHKIGGGIVKVAKNPIVQKVAITGAMVALGEEELEELFSFKHALSSVAHSPITKAVVTAGVRAAIA